MEKQIKIGSTKQIITSKISGAKLVMEKAKEWKRAIMNEGWEYTCDGWLSPNDIEASGLVYKNGEYHIPIQIYIAKDNNGGLKKGQKYRGAAEQYLQWRKRYQERKYGYKSIDEQIEKEIEMEIKIDE